MNQVLIVGRLASKVEIVNEEANEYKFTLSVPDNYKNQEGKYSVNNIDFIIKGGNADNMKKYTDIGDVVGIKAHIERKDDNMKILCERVSFLSSSKKQDKEEMER